LDNLDLNFNEIINMIESRRNNAYKKDYPIVSPLVTQISWTNNLLIMSGTNSIEEKEFYIKMCIKNNYSKRELDRQISSGYFHRYMLSDGKTNQSLTKAVGEEYRIQVGNQDFYIDLLFYNRALSCLVAFELKIGNFQPEYISKMDFYLEALDRQEKKENENPSVGVILCSGKDEQVVEYAMSRTMSPTMVSQYTLKLIDKKLLENKLKEINDIVEENIEKKE